MFIIQPARNERYKHIDYGITYRGRTWTDINYLKTLSFDDKIHKVEMRIHWMVIRQLDWGYQWEIFNLWFMFRYRSLINWKCQRHWYSMEWKYHEDNINKHNVTILSLVIIIIVKVYHIPCEGSEREREREREENADQKDLA